MSLRPAQRGYRYQDFMSARIILQQLFEEGNPMIRFDEKESKSDIIDDLKISYQDYKLCFQIKYTTTERVLSFEDIQEKGELNLSKLFGQYIIENSNVEYYFILKWGSPTESNISELLEKEYCPRYTFGNSATFRFKSEVYEKLKKFINISSCSKTLEKFLASIHFICDTPNASMNFEEPELLESELIAYAKKLGVDQYPNNKNISLFLTKLIDFIFNKRTASVYEVLKNDLLKDLDLITDYGSIPQKFYIDETKKLLLIEEIEEFHQFCNSNKKIIIEGEPGAGKSYFITEYMDYLNSKKIKYAHYYFFVKNNDDLSEKRINHNTMVGNLIREIYDKFPEISSRHVSEFSATITKLNELLLEINEPFYIILDGIDHFYRTYLNNIHEDIVSVIKKIEIPSNVKLILISQPIKKLRDECLSLFKIHPWNIKLTKDYSVKSGLYINELDIQKIHNLSKGNPLYTEYILNCIKTGTDSIDSLPTYSSNIETYYEYLFNRINDNELFGIIAVVPFLFTQEDIVEISNRGDFARNKFNELLPILNYLPLNGGYCIYHESLKRFVYDYCETHGIDLTRIKSSVFEWLKHKDFYKNEKSYIFSLQLALELKKYEWGASLVGYDFISNSLYYGYPLRSIKNNLEAIKNCICEINDYKKFAIYILCDEILQQKGNSNDDFLTDSINEYFKAFIALFGNDGVYKLLYRHNLRGDTYNKLIYSAYINNYINSPIDLIKTNDNYVLDEENTVSKIKAAYIVNNTNYIADIKEEIKEEDLVYLACELMCLKDDDFIKNYCNEDNINSNNLKRILNAFNCYSLYDVCLKYDIDYEYDLSKSYEIEGHVIDFISYSRTKITNNEIAKIHELTSEGFIYYFFEYIVNINTALMESDSNKKDRLILKALYDFTSSCEPFKGKIRSMDLSMPLFKKIFLFQLLTPIKCINDNGLQLQFIEGILKLYDKIEATISGSQMGCLVLFEIVENISLIAKEVDLEKVIKIIECKINCEKENALYNYTSSYYFSLASLASKIDIKRAEEYFKSGVNYALTYGFHKDPFLYDVFNSYESIEDLVYDKEQILKTLGNMAYGMYRHTDGRSTKQLPVSWFKAYLRYSPAGAIDYISNLQMKSKIKSWLNDSMISTCIEFIENYIDPNELYCILTCYQMSDIDLHVYLRLIDKFIKENKITLAENLISYMLGIYENKVLWDEKLYDNLMGICSKIKYSLPPLKKETKHIEPFKETSCESIALEAIINDPRLARKLNVFDLIKVIDMIEYGENTKQLIVDIFYESRWTTFSCTEINKLIDKIITCEDKKVFTYMCVFVVWNNGWFDQFVHLDSAKAAFAINAYKTDKAFFEIIKILTSHNRFEFNCVGNYLKYLKSINRECDKLLEIWKEIWKFANMRLPDLKQNVCEIKRIDEEINKVSSQLIIANINNFCEDNYRRAFCYFQNCVENNDSKTKYIVNFIFDNWDDLNIIAKLLVINELCFSNEEALNFVVQNKSRILKDNNILISAIGGIVFDEEINFQDVDLSSIVTCSPISNDEFTYAISFIDNYYLVSSFCQFYKIDESKILNYHKVNLQKYQNYLKDFWSNTHQICADNTIAYNCFFEAIDIVIKESYNNKLITTVDVFKLSVRLAEANRIAFIQPTMFMCKREDEILLAEFKSELIFDAYQRVTTQKVLYRNYILIIDDIPITIIENNLGWYESKLSCIRQIRFNIIKDVMRKLNWRFEILDGIEVILDEHDKIIGRYLTNKYGYLGLNYSHDQIYKYQEGNLLISLKAFEKLKDFFDSPNSKFVISEYKTHNIDRKIKTE